MIAIVPEWASHYEEFWASVRRRNLWFIKLRYGAVVMLAALIAGSKFLLKLELTDTQISAFTIITCLIFVYNALFQYLRDFVRFEADSFNPLHLSLLQIVFDLVSLTLLVYYGGSIENPLYMFYIFHMIIGSLLLPGVIIYAISFIVVSAFSLLALMEYNGIITHHGIKGLLPVPVYNDPNYILAFIIVFSMMMFISVIFANRIARELYRREQDLKETLNKLKEAESEKQKYIIGVVHEIKTPVSAVMSFLDLILQNFLGPVSENVAEKLTRARIRADEAIQMINNVLKISRLRLLDDLVREEIDIAEIIKDQLCSQKITADSKSIRLEFADNRKKKICIKGDKILMGIAVSNLISNSIKYIGFNGVICVRIDDENEKTLIEVCDNGIGIPKSDQDKIFKEFYRASNIKGKGYEGTGMGLSIVKQIINRHGGEITVSSPSRMETELKPGTCFTIILPQQK